MLCRDCSQKKENQNKSTENIKLIDRLLRITESEEDSDEKTARLHMLQKNMMTNYKVLDVLNYILSVRCEDCDRLN